MDNKELEIIKDLMDKLAEEMELKEDDFSERLGRKKPVVEIENSPKKEEECEDEDLVSMDLLEDEEEEESPENELKKRLMNLRK